MNGKISGIYAIFRKCDDKCMYIGQSKQCEARIHGHLNGSSNTPIENKDDYYADIIEKHGFDSNVFRLSREAFWINVFEPEWNIDKNRTRSEETKQKISIGVIETFKRPEVRQKISESLLGTKRSEETKQKISEARLGKTRSEETKQKISKALLGKHWKLVDGKRVWY